MTRAPVIDDAFLADVSARLRAGNRVRRALDEGGRLHVERQLPFLVVHRRIADREAPGTEALVTATASWMQASGERRHHRRLKALVTSWADVMAEAFGSTILLEIWSGPVEANADEEPPDDLAAPAFRILAPRRGPSGLAVRVLAESLGALRVRRRRARVRIAYTARRRPPGMPALLSTAEADARGCTVLGLEVRPVHADAGESELFPLVLRTLRRRLGSALHEGFFAFAHDQTTHRPAHYHELGRRVLSRAAREVDGRLAAISESFDFLLACTPVDTDPAWERFRRRGMSTPPTLHYRPLSFDPARLKRELYAAPIEKVEDPALSALFRGKQLELDRQLTLLLDRQTRRFLPGGLALYGPVEPPLRRLAGRVLRAIPPGRSESGRGTVDALGFAAAAERELALLRTQWPEMPGGVVVRKDLPAGLMVSHGRLLIGAGFRVPRSRVDALLQHEVGTHVLTYANGRAQPFQQLSVGLDGYDALQEGLAVLAEHLVGGLPGSRLRLLAGRVLAAASVEDGADFVETFALLTAKGFEHRVAFGVTMRVHRAGGLIKDAVYLRGLAEVLGLLADGVEIDDLYVGKIAAVHLGTVRELRRRRILIEPPLRPRFLTDPDAAGRLRAVRAGVTVIDLAKEAR